MTSAVIDIAEQDDAARRALRLKIADATSTVGAIEAEIARLRSRLRLAKAHATYLNNEHFLLYGAYP